MQAKKFSLKFGLRCTEIAFRQRYFASRGVICCCAPRLNLRALKTNEIIALAEQKLQRFRQKQQQQQFWRAGMWHIPHGAAAKVFAFNLYKHKLSRNLQFYYAAVRSEGFLLRSFSLLPNPMGVESFFFSWRIFPATFPPIFPGRWESSQRWEFWDHSFMQISPRCTFGPRLWRRSSTLSGKIVFNSNFRLVFVLLR